MLDVGLKGRCGVRGGVDRKNISFRNLEISEKWHGNQPQEGSFSMSASF